MGSVGAEPRSNEEVAGSLRSMFLSMIYCVCVRSDYILLCRYAAVQFALLLIHYGEEVHL